MARVLPSLAVIFMLLFFITKFSSARTLNNVPSSNNHNHGHHRITFLMRYMFNGSSTQHSSEKPATTKVNGQPPFPTPQSTPTIPLTSSSSTQTLDLSSIVFSFPTRVTLQELEYAIVTSIDEELLQDDGDDELLHQIGKAQGVCVASSDDGSSSSSHMMAITARFLKGDELRLFGMHKSDVIESHVAVIGGTGKYYGANGYAAVKVVDKVGSSAKEGRVTSSKFLLFDVYLS